MKCKYCNEILDKSGNYWYCLNCDQHMPEFVPYEKKEKKEKKERSKRKTGRIKSKLNKKSVKKIIKLREEGGSIVDISIIMNISVGTIRTVLNGAYKVYGHDDNGDNKDNNNE